MSLLCHSCQFMLTLDNFNYAHNITRGYGYYCKVCTRERSQVFRAESESAFWAHLPNLMQQTTEKRQVLRPDIKDTNLAVGDLLHMYDQQGKRCFYSGVPIFPFSLAEWMVSVERFDPLNGSYVLGEVALVAIEFNNFTQWNQQKVVEALIRCDNDTVDEARLATLIAHAKLLSVGNTGWSSKKIPIPQRINGQGETLYECRLCKEFKHPEEYRTKKVKNGRRSVFSGGCRKCDAAKRRNKPVGLRKFILDTVSSCWTNTKIRNERGREHEDPTVDFDFLLDLLWEQRGKCRYSGIAITHVKHRNWRMSLERLDESQGYLKENVAWIAKEFNGTHNRQWSCEKFQFMKEHASRKYATELANFDLATLYPPSAAATTTTTAVATQ